MNHVSSTLRKINHPLYLMAHNV